MEDRVWKRISMRIGFEMDIGRVLCGWINLGFNRCYCLAYISHGWDFG